MISSWRHPGVEQLGIRAGEARSRAHDVSVTSRKRLRAQTSRLPTGRHAILRAWFAALTLVLLVAAGLPARGAAQVGARALPALLTTPRWLRPAGTSGSLAASAGYGASESLLRGDGAHHSGLGGLGVAVNTPWGLGSELRVDGRYERSQLRGEKDSGWVGALRGYLRYAHALRSNLNLGAELGMWLPGARAPSLRLNALTLDGLLGLDAFVTDNWSLIAAAGFRFDQSAQAMPDAQRLSTGDYLALRLSDSHAALARLGSEVSFSRAHVFAEWTWDILLGADAPALLKSPMQLGLGARLAFDAEAKLEFVSAARVLVTARPAVDLNGPLVPFLPRAELWAGLHYRFGAHASQKPAALTAAPAPAPQAIEPQAPVEPAIALAPELPVTPEPSTETGVSVTAGVVRLLVRDHRTGEPLVAQIQIRAADDGATTPQEHVSSREGRLELTLPAGRYVIQIKLHGYRKQRKTVTIEDQSVTMLDVALHARSKR